MSGPYGCGQRLQDGDGGVLQLLKRARVKICLTLNLGGVLELLAGDACQVLCGVSLVELGPYPFQKLSCNFLRIMAAFLSIAFLGDDVLT